MKKNENKMGKLLIVATPIGNLADITLRALETLKKVDLVLCEDSRVTSVLLRNYSIDKPLLVYNDHSDEYVRNKILDKLSEGKDLALVSDAGTPLISDPGYKLIKDLKDRDIEVHTIPGPCSIIAAITLAALPTDRFSFIGFLPHKNSAKENLLTEFANVKTSLVFFESANRLIDSLKLIDLHYKNRNVAVVREITKLFEQSINGTALEVIQYYQENSDRLRGEIVLLVGPPKEDARNYEDEIIDHLSKLMQDMSLRDAVEAVNSQYKMPKKQIYKFALKIKS